MQTKSFCEDLTEGKFSFPIIHAVHSDPKDTRLINILRQRTEDADVKRHAVKWMVKCGSIAYTREVLRQLHAEVEVEIEKLGGHPQLSALLERLDSALDTDINATTTPKSTSTGDTSSAATGTMSQLAVPPDGSVSPHSPFHTSIAAESSAEAIIDSL